MLSIHMPPRVLFFYTCNSRGRARAFFHFLLSRPSVSWKRVCMRNGSAHARGSSGTTLFGGDACGYIADLRVCIMRSVTRRAERARVIWLIGFDVAACRCDSDDDIPEDIFVIYLIDAIRYWRRDYVSCCMAYFLFRFFVFCGTWLAKLKLVIYFGWMNFLIRNRLKIILDCREENSNYFNAWN